MYIDLRQTVPSNPDASAHPLADWPTPRSPRPLLTIVVTTLALLVIGAAAARADGEGAGDPFAFHAPGQVFGTVQPMAARAATLDLPVPPAARATAMSAAPRPANDRLAFQTSR